MPSRSAAERDRAPSWERLAASGLAAAVAALAAARMLYAGGLWRDEAGAARLAALPGWRQIVALFPHEAFPPLFPFVVRAYTRLAGDGDLALRAFGLAVWLAVAALLWRNARTTARTLPLLSLALVGLDAPFLVFGESLRGYGLGCACILLLYGLLARGLAAPAGRPLDDRGGGAMALAAVTAAAAVASVQLVLGNAALVLALTLAAAVVAAARRRWRRAASALAGAAAAAASLLPYRAELADAQRQWGDIVTYRIGLHQIWNGLIATVGPRPVLGVWLLLAGIGLAGLGRALHRQRTAAAASSADAESWRIDMAAFAGLTIVGALVAQAAFLEVLGYTPRPWYFLSLLALLATALDTLFGALSRAAAGRYAAVRLAAVALVVAAQVIPLSAGVEARQTNADLVARRLERAAAPRDLVVVIPWYDGVSFARYYRGAAPWTTLPEIADHRFHRYDLLRAKLAARAPLADLLQAVAATLRAGHRVWLVGRPRWPRRGEIVAERPPAPRSADGWHDQPYIIDWSRQLGAFLESHARSTAVVPVAVDAPVSGLEDLSLVVVEGWR